VVDLIVRGHWPAGIGQLADVCRLRNTDHGDVEIRIVLDTVEPPAGRLLVVCDPGETHKPGSEPAISFTGWLGLLRALYQATAEPGLCPYPGL
jgi:hypothetical protein